MFRRPSGLLVPDAAAPRGPRVRVAGADELPPLAGGAPSWLLYTPFVLYNFAVNGSSNVTRKVGEEASENSPNLLSLDTPTKLTEWELTSINLLVRVESLSPVEPAPANTQRLTVQLLIGGDVVWQQSQEQAVPAAVATPFSPLANYRISGDFNNPIALPTGRSLQLRASVSVSVETKQILAAIVGNNGTQATLGSISGAGSFSSISYNVRHLTGHRTL